MTTINTTAITAGDMIHDALEGLLNGLLREQRTYRTKGEQARNEAARRGAELLAQDLLAVWCPDADTLFANLPVPQRGALVPADR